MKRSRGKKQPARTPCLCLERRGGPQIEYFPRAGVETPEGVVVVDGLVKASWKGHTLWAMVEIDEDPTPSAESLRREHLVPMPTIRVTPADLMKQDLMGYLDARLRLLMDVAA